MQLSYRTLIRLVALLVFAVLPIAVHPDGRFEKDMEKAEKQKEVSQKVQEIFNEGLLLAEQGKYDEAIERYEKALDKDPEQPNILANMADAYSKAGKDEKARECYEKAIAIKPTDAALHNNLGIVLSGMGKDAEAQEAFKKAAALDPGRSAQHFYNIGATLANKGLVDEAAAAFRQAIAADPDFGEAYFQLGMCLSGNPETMGEAIESLTKYTQIGKRPDQIEVAKQVIAALEKGARKQP